MSDIIITLFVHKFSFNPPTTCSDKTRQAYKFCKFINNIFYCEARYRNYRTANCIVKLKKDIKHNILQTKHIINTD